MTTTLAVWKFASCDGCQLSLLDCEDELLAVADRVGIAHFLEATRRVEPGPYDISLVEGSITTAEDAERIQRVREMSRTLVTIGACSAATSAWWSHTEHRVWGRSLTLAAARSARPTSVAATAASVRWRHPTPPRRPACCGPPACRRPTSSGRIGPSMRRRRCSSSCPKPPSDRRRWPGHATPDRRRLDASLTPIRCPVSAGSSAGPQGPDISIGGTGVRARRGRPFTAIS